MSDLLTAVRPVLPGPPADGPARARDVLPRRTASTAAVAAAVLSAVLWAVSLRSFDLAATSGFGLLDAAPAVWFAAVGLAAVPYVVLAARGTVGDAALWLLHGALVLVLSGTTAVLYDEPRYTWMYKHLGVVEYLLANGHLDRTIDIYHNWPGFFVLVAGLVEVLRVDPLTLARWAEPFFGVLTGAAVHYAVGGLTRDRRLRWTTVALFTLTNWIGQGYLAPQALALVLALVVLGGVLRVGCRTADDGAQALRSLPRRVARRFGIRPEPTTAPVPAPTGARAALATAVPVAAFAALAVTHQLTPVAVLVQLAVLAAVVTVRPWWLLAVPVAVEAGWMALAWPYLSTHTRIFSFDLAQNVQVPGAAQVASLPGMAVAQWSGPAVMLAVGLLAAAGVVVQWRRGAVSVGALVLAASPVLILGGSSYGSEAVFRVYLYALPWLAFLAAHVLVPAVVPGHRAAPAGRGPALRAALAEPALVRGVLVCALLLPTCLVASFFLEKGNVVTAQDLRTARWYEERSTPDSYAVMVAPSYPTRLTAQYPEHIVEDGAFAPAVTSWMEPTGRAEDALAGAAKAFGHYSWRPGYLVMTPSQRNYAQMWGLLTGAEYDRFVQLVVTSPDYQVVHRDGDAVVARYVGAR